jgi:ferrous iron transport protein A
MKMNVNISPMNLAQVPLGVSVLVRDVAGERAFRRRLLELGLVPGTAVAVLKVAPLGDPIELAVRGCRLSIRASEARAVEVDELALSEVSEPLVASAGALAVAVGKRDRG